MMRQEQIDNLRKGYTTGACATAGAVAGWQLLNGGVTTETVVLLLPNDQTLTIPLAKVERTANEVVVEIIKDAGDDPDVTDKMTIQVGVRESSKAEINAEDYLESCGSGFIIIKGGAGVGLVTRPGLDATVGKWAINSSPRKILVNNLKNAGFGAECSYLIVEITAVNGSAIARKTLNPMLGVIDGISILGTTGIVVPYSNAAYIKTIEIRVRCAAEEGAEELAFTTGSRTKHAILRDCPRINEATCIRIGDFIAASLKAVAATELKIVNVACMPGKLYKYACGHEYTHAHKVRLKPDLMLKELKLLGVEQIVLDKIEKCDTVGEAASILEYDIYRLLLDNLAEKALGYLSQWAGKVKVNLYVYDLAGKSVLERVASRKIKGF